MEKHFTTSVYVYNPDIDKFLFIYHKKLQKWLQPGGHIEPNENPEDCAIREVKEETGLDVEFIGDRMPRETDLIKPFAIQLNKINDEHQHFDIIYLTKTSQTNFQKNEIETEGINWYTADEILNDNFDTFDAQKMWIKYFKDNMADLLK